MACDTMGFMSMQECGYSTFYEKSRRSRPQNTSISVRFEPYTSKREADVILQSRELMFGNARNRPHYCRGQQGITNFKQQAGQSAVKYEQALRTKALRGGPIYDKYHVKRDFCEGLRQSIQHIGQGYCAKN